MKRKIRLTESEFHTLIKRMVNEVKNQYDEELIEDEGEDMTKGEAIRKIADYFSTQVLPELEVEEVEELKDKVDQAKSKVTDHLSEEEENNLDSRMSSMKEKLMMRGGLGTAALGAVLSLGEFMGYSDFEITGMLHDLNAMAGLGRYTGPVTVGMVFLGLAMALKGLDTKMRRTED